MAKGVFVVFPVGKSADPSNKGKRKYTFVEGTQVKANGDLFDNCNIIEFWSDDDLKIKFLAPLNAVLDRSTIQGKKITGENEDAKEFIRLVKILPDTTTMLELHTLMIKLAEEDRVEKLRKRKQQEAEEIAKAAAILG